MLPGFVDSHAHLVFAGERSAEFAARMAGRAYQAGGIRTTVAATRAATDAELRAGLHRLAGEMLRQGTTTFECKSGYGLTTNDEARCAALAAETHGRGHLPRRARGARRVRRRPRRLRRPGVRADAGRVRGALPLGRRVLRARRVRRGRGARGAHGRPGARTAPAGPREPAWPGTGHPACRGARRGLCRPLHVCHRCRRVRPRVVAHRRHPAARRGVQHQAALPGRPPPARRRRDGRPGDRLQSRHVLHDVDAVLRCARGTRHAHDNGGSGLVGYGGRRPRAAPRATSATWRPARAPTWSSWTPRHTRTSRTGRASRWSTRSIGPAAASRSYRT